MIQTFSAFSLLSSPRINDFISPKYCWHRQLGGLGVLREVVHGFSEEARTRGFASLTFVRLAFVEAILVITGMNVAKFR